MNKYAKQFMGAIVAPLLLANALSLSFSLSLPALASEEAKQKVLEAGTSKSVRPIRDKWAVVIGVDSFKDKRIPQLHFSAKDAADFAKFLVDKANFAPDHVLLLLNDDATHDNITAAICDDWLPKRVDENDLVLIYASSHGSPKELDRGGENFLICHDTNEDKLFTSGINLSDLSPVIKRRTKCDRVVLILDACNSGAATTASKGLYRAVNFDPDAIAGTGQIVISSSSAEQRSWESKRYQNGVFTRNLIDTLSDGKTDIISSFGNLKDKVQSEVRFDRQAFQTPSMSSKWEGDPLIISAKPSSPQALPSDDDSPYTYKSFVSGRVVKKAPVPEVRQEPIQPINQTQQIQQVSQPSALPAQPVVNNSPTALPAPQSHTTYSFNYGSRAPEVQKKAAPVGKEADYWFKFGK